MSFFIRPLHASTGIPRETLRRKVQWLQEQGWIEKNAKSHLIITLLLAEAFKEFNQEMLTEFFNIYERIQTVLFRDSAAYASIIMISQSNTEI